MEEEKQKQGWIIEQCRFCGKRMYALQQRPKINAQTGQQYLETQNNCPHCDYWITTRIPYALARTVSSTIHLPTPEEVASMEERAKHKAAQTV
jgi:hypothetical protein